MMTMRNFASSLLLVSLVLMGCQEPPDTTDALPFYQDASLTPQWITKAAAKDDALHRIDDFAFVNQEGETVTRRDLAGHIYVANFFFVHCAAICPTMRTNLAKVQQAFLEDDEVVLLSHTVMPETDSVPVLENYAKVNGVISGKWHLVTGERDDLYTLAREAYFAEVEFLEGDDAPFLHTENFVLVDQAGHIRGVYNGTLPFDVQRLIEDIATLLG